jgi:hypothetical protein
MTIVQTYVSLIFLTGFEVYTAFLGGAGKEISARCGRFLFRIFRPENKRDGAYLRRYGKRESPA